MVAAGQLPGAAGSFESSSRGRRREPWRGRQEEGSDGCSRARCDPRGPPRLGTRWESSPRCFALAWRSLSPGSCRTRSRRVAGRDLRSATLRVVRKPEPTGSAEGLCRCRACPIGPRADDARRTAAPSLPGRAVASSPSTKALVQAPPREREARHSPGTPSRICTRKHHEDPPSAARMDRPSGNSGRLRRRLEHGRETSRFWSRLPRAIVSIVGQWLFSIR